MKNRPTRTQAIKNFLLASTHPDLASLYNFNMEVQVNVAQDSGNRIDGDYKGKQWHGFTDGLQIWKPIRIPYKANSEPEYTDIEITFDLAEHAEGIGMTGFDWVDKCSRWVFFDFDAISGHSEKHTKKLTELELKELEEKLVQIPWVTLRKSTSGKGRHVYIFLTPVATKNHVEHAALARAILSKMSAAVNFDFNAKVDTCGGNGWVWHRKMKGTDGLTLIKQGERLSNPPSNWEDHVKVITGRRVKNLPKFIEQQESSAPEIEDKFAELIGQRVRIALDEEHKKLMNWIDSYYPNSSWWDQDHWMYVTHTVLLAEAHDALNFRGPFATISVGREKGHDHNVYMSPMRNGAWSVRRFSPGCEEHPSWTQDSAGWTRTYYNRLPDFRTACRMHNGVEDPVGGFWFNTADEAQKAALILGADLKLPNYFLNRKCKLKEHKSGRLQIEMPSESGDPPINGWLNAKNKWGRLFDVKMSESNEPEIIVYDDEVRHLVAEDHEDYGWVIQSNAEWHAEPFQHVKSYLKSRGHKPNDVENILGSSISRCWTIVNQPFKDEYPSDRKWNRNAAQLRYKPTINRDNLQYPHWLKILQHIGQSLDEAIINSSWCKANGLICGADYLKIWISSLFKFPEEPLPYLFLYGPQNSGKSILHEALSILMTSGVARADTSLISQSNFNGELENALLCIVEETDLRLNKTAYNRIKDWVTSIRLPIHKKGKQPYTVKNTAHWIQCANTHLYCPVFQGDSRITMINVPALADPIPKKDLMSFLEKEAPDFLAEILTLELPQSNDRLNVPIIITEDKLAAETANLTFLETFINEKCYFVTGTMIKFSEFYDRFIEWIDPNYIREWSKIKVGRELPPKFPKGRQPKDSQYYIGNISFKARDPDEEIKPRYILKDGFLILSNGELHDTRTVNQL